MWLKLETGMLLMLLLFSVLLGGEKKRKGSKDNRYDGKKPQNKCFSKRVASWPLLLNIFLKRTCTHARLYGAPRWEYNTSLHADGKPSHLRRTCKSAAARVRAPVAKRRLNLLSTGDKKEKEKRKSAMCTFLPARRGSSCGGSEPGRFNQRNSPLLISQAALQHPRPLPRIRPPPHQQAASVHLHAPL